MTFLFFLYLAMLQVVLGVVGAGGAAALSSLASLRPYRARMIGSAAWGAAGGFLGAIGGFALVVITGLAWLGMRFVHLVSHEAEMSEQVMWAFPVGYLSGLAGGAIFGWRRRARSADDPVSQTPTQATSNDR